MINSSIKSFENEIKNLESEYNRTIPKNNYYIVKCVFDEDLNTSNIKKLNDYLCSLDENIAIYSSSGVFLIIKCSGENESDITNSSIISFYCGRITKEINTIPEVLVICFNSQTQLALYVFFEIYKSSLRKMSSLCKSITAKELHFKTESELKEILMRNNIEWDKISKESKYGTITKLTFTNKGKILTNSLSEMPDAREINKYVNFIFS